MHGKVLKNKAIHNVHLIKRTREKSTVYTNYETFTNYETVTYMQKIINNYINWQHIDLSDYII